MKKNKITVSAKNKITISEEESKSPVLEEESKSPVSAFFLGPHAENFEVLSKLINEIMLDYTYWRRNYFSTDPIVKDYNNIQNSSLWYDNLDIELRRTLNNLKAHYPFYSPRYMAHMLSEQTIPSIVGYFAGMLYNPNNVTDEAAPVTVDIEIEFGKMICEMLGYQRENSWAHICSGGTLANLEALWVARETQFIPLVIKEFCEKKKFADKFKIRIPNGDKKTISNIQNKTLLQLRPNDALCIIKNLIEFLIKERGYETKNALKQINDFIPKSKFSIKHRGIHSVLDTLGLKPIIFVPESAHYCFRKAVNLLGYGENVIRSIPVTNTFRINVDALREMILNLNACEYIAGVVCVVGTTEEGAVDPVHRVKFLRDEFEQNNNQSFWIHVDSAWGGYIRSLFIDEKYTHIDVKSDVKNGGALDQIVSEYIETMNMEEDFTNANKKNLKLVWQDKEVIKAFLAMPDADSITVDPHKLGYVPYPAGVIAFKNKNVTQLVAQKAQYISDTSGNIESAEVPKITAVGSYILEGSKPGAAAMSCWLSAKTIPLNLHNHGKIIKTTLLNAQRFAYCIREHHKMTFLTIEKELGYKELPNNPFKFVPLYDTIDTNVVCFIVLPMAWEKEKMYKNGSLSMSISNWTFTPQMQENATWGLKELNDLNKKIYEDFTITNVPCKQKTPPYRQQFFVSKTKLEKDQYAYNSIKDVLDKLYIKKESYENEGLFVLRSTIMNPWYYKMNAQSYNYFELFIKELHKSARDKMNSRSNNE